MRKQFPAASLKPLLFPETSWVDDFLLFNERQHFYHHIPQIKGQRIPSILNLASKEIISDSVELYDTDVCLLHIQLMGTNVRLPKMHKVLPDVDFESSESPANSES